MNHCRICFRIFTRQELILLNSSSHRHRMCQQHLQSSSQAVQYSSKSKSREETRQPDEDKEEPDVPYTFSTSRAAKWSVDKSFGSQYSRPLWKVAPLSLALFAFMAWVFLRSETELDRRLEVTLSERLPDLFTQSEGESQEKEADDVTINAR